MSQASEGTIPESQYSAFASDDGINRIPETQPSQQPQSQQPGPSRQADEFHARVPGGGDFDDIRDLVSDVEEETLEQKANRIQQQKCEGEDSESDLDDVPPAVNQTGRGANQQGNQESMEDDEFNSIRYVNDIFALRSKKCKYCPRGITYLSVGALLAHIRDAHLDFYTRYIINLQQGQGDIDENSPIFPISCITRTLDRQNELYKLDIKAKINERKVTWTDLNAFLKAIRKSLALKLNEIYDNPLKADGLTIKQFKVYFNSTSLYSKVGETPTNHPFQTNFYEIRHKQDINDTLSLMVSYLMQRLDEHTVNGSGFIHEKVTDFRFTIARWKVLAGAAASNQELPPLLRTKHRSLFNVGGVSNKCFMHSIISHFEILKKKNAGYSTTSHSRAFQIFQDASYYDALFKRQRRKFTYTKQELFEDGSPEFEAMHEDSITIDFTGIKFPMTMAQINKFQFQNPNLGLCILGYNDEDDFEKRQKPSAKPQPISAEFVQDSSDEDGEDEGEEISPAGTSESKASFQKLYKTNQCEIRKRIHPFHVTLHTTDFYVDILYVFRDDYGHFLNIKDMTGFVGVGHKGGMEMCRFCIHWFSKSNIKEHVSNCSQMEKCKTNMPKQDLRFKDYHRTLPSAYTFFLDFECILEKESRTKGANGEITSNHTPSGYAWMCLDYENKIAGFQVYRQDPTSANPELHENVGRHCLRTLLDFAKDKQELLDAYNEEAKTTMKFESEEHEAEISRKLKDPNYKFEKEVCCLCEKPLQGYMPSEHPIYVKSLENLPKGVEKPVCIVKHHSHLPPYNFIGLAHSTPCNTTARIRKSFSVFAHNFTGYDSHLVVMAAENEDLVTDISMMGSSSEKITALTINKTLQFVDSSSFFGGASLDATVKSLGPDDFELFKEFMGRFCKDRDVSFTENLFNRLKDKGAYPYSYMSSFDKFKETALPDKADFYNDLGECHIEDDVYENAQQVWDLMSIKDMGEWHDLYVMIDTLLLTICFAKLRKVMFGSFNLCVTHYVSLPSFTLDACLKYTKETIELTRDPDIYLFLEQAVLGGLCTIGDEKVVKANNEYCEGYDPEKPSSWLLYCDKNNLYGASMVTPLPVGDYHFKKDEELLLKQNDAYNQINQLDDDGDYGEIWDVSIMYPKSKHEEWNAYPPAPSKTCIKSYEVSCEQRRLANFFGVGDTAWKTEKMVADLKPKRIKSHYRALKLWIRLGVKITKVHKVLGFRQKAWMAPYVIYNSIERAKTTIKVEINLRKFLNNSLYGKQIQNARKRVNMILINNTEKRLRYAKKPTLKYVKILNEKLTLAVLSKTSVTLNSNMPSGVTILEEARKNMYSFWYDFIKKNYPSATLCYSDTDSHVIKIECENVYAEMKKHSTEFDMSEYDQKHKIWKQYYDGTNKRVLNKMKDEVSNGILTRFCALKSKLYSYEYVQIDDNCKVIGKKQEKKAKGVARVAVKRTKFEQYLKCIEEPIQTTAQFNSIRSFDHHLVTMKQTKKCLNRFDNKRFEITPAHSLALGHKDIPIYNNYTDYEWINIKTIFDDPWERKAFRRLCQLDIAQEKLVQDMIN